MRHSLIFIAAATLGLAACGPSGDIETHGDGTHWSYAHQDDWAELGEDHVTCGTGVRQSPINMAMPEAPVDNLDLVTNFAAGSGSFVNNGHTLQFTPGADGSTMFIGADTYALLQLHFHTPSEHRIEGEQFPLELHFVTRNEAGELAVLGVLFREGTANAGLAALLDALPEDFGDAFATSPELDPDHLLPAERTYFAYSGSLTTPPCTEGVRWNVLSTLVEASAEQFAAFDYVLGYSAREVQPLNDRDVSLGE